MGETLKRAIFGSIFVALVVAACIYSSFSLTMLMLVVSTIGLYEWCRMQGADSMPILVFSLILNYMILGWNNPVLIILGFGSSAVAIGQMAVVLFVFAIWVLVKYKTEAIDKLAVAINGLVLISLPCLLLLRMQPFKAEEYQYVYPLAVFILIWISDTMAYVAGRLFGKHKLFEILSPKKTVEGWIGGAFFTAIAGAFLYYLWEIGPLWQGFVLAFVIAIFGVFGDLFISSIKRKTGLKDTGNIIPGHGGIIDRFDAFFFAVPAAYAWYAFTLVI